MPLPTRRLIALAVFLVPLIAARPAMADVQQYLGKTITDVRVEIAGVPLLKDTVLELVARRGEAEELGDVVARHRITLPQGHIAYVRIYPQP